MFQYPLAVLFMHVGVCGFILDSTICILPLHPWCVGQYRTWGIEDGARPALAPPHESVMGEAIHMLSRGSLSRANSGGWVGGMHADQHSEELKALWKPSAHNITRHTLATETEELRESNQHKTNLVVGGEANPRRQQTGTSMHMWNQRQILF